ncbi:hypothetical protein SAMN05660405_00595 [Psychrobacter pacificensis]|uniref:Uncharacterized protein n=1 Tax=Psychrobacter pacificensis TaxID=112002 RepID=A0A1G6VJF5_9GAMM|nr:hypothetical protein SAMN05660405_00595 [Psychrobacter pacificensis]
MLSINNGASWLIIDPKIIDLKTISLKNMSHLKKTEPMRSVLFYVCDYVRIKVI